IADDKFIQEGFALLNSATGIAQFYDRDAPAEMAKAGMEGFQKFMLDPSTKMEVLERLDEVAAEVYAN
ncbi:MAG: carbohydrate ABC transporter substrate-binding protein, partial [Pseudomonadota bacterium]